MCDVCKVMGEVKCSSSAHHQVTYWRHALYLCMAHVMVLFHMREHGSISG